MGINLELAKKAEILAKAMAVKTGHSKAMWELFLPEAYKRLVEGLKKLGHGKSEECSDCSQFEPKNNDPEGYCKKHQIFIQQNEQCENISPPPPQDRRTDDKV